MKKLLAFTLSAMMVFSNTFFVKAQAQEIPVVQEVNNEESLQEEQTEKPVLPSDESGVTSDNEAVEREETVDETEEEQGDISDENGLLPDLNEQEKDNLFPEETLENEKDTEDIEDTEILPQNQGSEEKTPILVTSEDVLNYLYIEHTDDGEVKNIVVSMGEDSFEIESASMVIETEEGEIALDASALSGNAALFSGDFSADITSDQIKMIKYSDAGDIYELPLNNQDLDSVELSLGGDTTESAEPEVTEEIVTFDADGNPTEQKTIADAIDAATAAQEDQTDGISMYAASSDTRAVQNTVIVLDPGHDASHAGARANGLNEETLTLKIAQYCKAALEQYPNVKVYMTRSGSGCPFPGTSSADCNANRVTYAKNVGADVYVSIHLNSSPSASAGGAEVYYPNSNYLNWVGNEGKELASKIESQLSALGLENRGIKIRNSADGTTYPDGSLADYYGVIRRSKLEGIPAVIVEHAFLTNTSDASKFLNNEAGLKKLGEADAKGIADYFGFSKQTVKFSYSAASAKQNTTSQSLIDVSVSGIAPNDKLSKVRFAVWSETNGQDDLQWYDIQSNSSGNYSTQIDIKNHNMDDGLYHIDVYVTDIYGNSSGLANLSCNIVGYAGMKNADYMITADPMQKEYTVGLKNLKVTGVKTVKLAVWSSENGQDDLIWYSAGKTASGTYVATIPIKNHKTEGKYYVDAYATLNAGGEVPLGSATFEVTGPSMKYVITSQMNEDAGTYNIDMRLPTAPSGLASVRTAVWSKSDQSDMHWYEAKKLSNGNYVAYANIANHKYNYGTYNIHVYATDNNGINKFLGKTTVTINKPTLAISAVGNSSQTQYTVTASGLGLVSGLKSVQFAVWSEVNGQDDIRWYNADKTNGRWIYTIPISNHKSEGKYKVHAYIVMENGTKQYVGQTAFEVTGPSMRYVITTQMNEDAGTYNIDMRLPESPSGIVSIRAAVWSKSDQSDMHWYQANKLSNGNYVAYANIANHKYNYGTYNIHVYATDNNGIDKFVGKTTVTINRPEAKISAVGNSSQTQYTINASGVGYESSLKGVQFAVWSTANGQDDIQWYSANKTNGRWMSTVPINRHKTEGKYNVHAYVILGNGVRQYVGQTTFEVTGPSMRYVITTQMNEDAGTYNIDMRLPESPSGIASIRAAVWSKSDQSDMHWYQANKLSNGNYVAYANIGNHKYNYGTYNIHVYATDNNGIDKFVGKTTVTINRPEAKISAAGNSSQTQYTINASGVGYGSSLKGVQFAVWSTANGQDDIQWYNAIKTNGRWMSTVPISRHKTEGKYNVHTYVLLGNGIRQYVGQTTFEVTGPSMKYVITTQKNADTGTYNIDMCQPTSPSGIASIRAAVWSKSDQSDMHWYEAKKLSNGNYVAYANIVNHKYNYGTYNIHVYAADNNGIEKFVGKTTIAFERPNTKLTATGNSSQTQYTITATGVGYGSALKGVQFAVWSDVNGQDDICWYDASKIGARWEYTVPISRHGSVGTYQVHMYGVMLDGSRVFMGNTTFFVEGYEIMGTTGVTREQMIRYYNQNASYPGYYAESDAPNIETFCQIYLEESQAEGVKAEVAFCQAMKETGWLKFGGDVDISQYNFAGLGATGNGAKGNSFDSVRIGVRAQIQHLKAYASTQGLNQACVDSRYTYVRKGSAPYVQWLGISENPYGTGWATARGYGINIVDRINNLKSY